MTVLQTAPRRILGFDVAKDTIALFDSAGGQTRTIPNRAVAIRRCLDGLDGVGLAVCEPTGGHEAALLQALVAANIPCHRADTLKVKAFIRSFGTLAKTDALDARALARYGHERWAHLILFEPPDADQQALCDLVTRRLQLVEMKVAEQNRAKGARAATALKASCRAMLRTLNTQIARIERAIEALVAHNADLADTMARYRKLPGIGPRTAEGLAAFMPELGHLSRRKAAALAGVAPHPSDSGTRRGYRSMRGGRPRVRAILFMAALTAARVNGPFKDFYSRLIQNGKKPIVAIAALMRKIIVVINAKQRHALLQQS